jgi:hypothetical protein
VSVSLCGGGEEGEDATHEPLLWLEDHCAVGVGGQVKPSL